CPIFATRRDAHPSSTFVSPFVVSPANLHYRFHKTFANQFCAQAREIRRRWHGEDCACLFGDVSAPRSRETFSDFVAKAGLPRPNLGAAVLVGRHRQARRYTAINSRSRSARSAYRHPNRLRRQLSPL